MKKILLGFVFIILIVLCSCSKKNHLQNVQENLLLQTDSAFSKYSEQFGIANAYEKYIDDDAISFPQNRMPVKGKLSILNSFKKSNEYNLIWFPAFAEVSRTGDL